MAVRQYIGARYVPTYYQNSQDPTSSEWEPNVRYDPLTIVSLPNLHSYQSKKLVPANIGSPALNPEYWYDQGYASAYYQALQDQIDEINQQISTVKFNCGVVLGDSYASGTGSPEGYGLFHYINIALLREGHLYSGSGTAFIDYDGNHTNDTFLTHLSDAINDNNLDNSKVDVIFILGAYGDSRVYIANSRQIPASRSALDPAISSFVSDAFTNFPNLKKIYYVTAESRAVNQKITGSFTSYVDDTFMTCEMIAPLLEKYQIVNLGWCGLSALYDSSLFSSDGYHLNTAGYSLVANTIINKVNGSDSNYYYVGDIQVDISAFTGITGSYIDGRVLISETDCEFDFYFISIPAGTLNISTNYVTIDLSSDLVAPFKKSRRNRARTTLCKIGTDYAIINLRPQVNNNVMCIEFRSDIPITSTLGATTIVNFDNFV